MAIRSAGILIPLLSFTVLVSQPVAYSVSPSRAFLLFGGDNPCVSCEDEALGECVGDQECYDTDDGYWVQVYTGLASKASCGVGVDGLSCALSNPATCSYFLVGDVDCQSNLTQSEDGVVEYEQDCAAVQSCPIAE